MVAEQPGEPRRIATIGAQLEEAAARFGTPLYVLEAASLSHSASVIELAFPDPWTRQYSLKANDLPELVSFLLGRGWGANVVSAGEWSQARMGGAGNNRVTFEGIGKTDAELEQAVSAARKGAPLRWLALESAAEALQLAVLAQRAGLGRDGVPSLDVLLRLNPQVQPETVPGLAVGAASSKFGMDAAEVMSLVQPSYLPRGLRVRGIHVHVGSDLQDVTAWAHAGVRAVRLLRDVSAYADTADTVDFGGGFPLPVAGAPAPADFRTALLGALGAAGLELPPRCAVEPGRYLVGGAGWLVSRVLHSRARPPYRQQVVLDAGMTELMRPALYGSRHPIHALGRDGAGHEPCATAVEGPVCESTDSFGVHSLPVLRRSDLVAIEGAGAYAASMTSRYNGRPQPTEVLLWPDGSMQQCERVDVTRRRIPDYLPQDRPVRS